MAHKRSPCDRIVFFIASLLLLSGVAFVYSASAEVAAVRFGSTEQLAFNHALRVALSLVLMYTISRIDYHVLIELSRPLLVLAIVLLVFVLVRGTALKGASRWLEIAGVSLQPSEYVKFALLFHIAVRSSLLQTELWDWKRGLVPLLAWITTVVILIAAQPNLSTALLIFFLSLMILWIGGTRTWHIATVVLIGMVCATLYALSAPYRLQRLTSYASAIANDQASYQLEQALIGLANGGIIGVGPGQSRARDLFLPESFGDFIVSIIGEEYGFIGIIAVLVCYGVIVSRGIMIARMAPDTLGYLLAWSISLTIGWYALINIAVSCGLLPTTGIPLPLVSYGGSSIVFTACALGILLNISRHASVIDRYESAD